MAAPRSNTGRPTACIFCGQPKLTKQHLWPKWLAKIIPVEPGRYQRADAVLVYSTKNVVLPNGANVMATPTARIREKKPSAANTAKLRIACAKCNNGWMSKVEHAAKRAVAGAAKGDDFVMGEADLRALALWATLMTVVAEYLDPDHLAVDAADRHLLAEQASVPLNRWVIYVGRYTDHRDWGRYRYSHRPLGQASEAQSPHYALQSSTFSIGELILHVRSSRDDCEVQPPSRFLLPGLVRLWPPSMKKLSWRTMHGWKDEQLEALNEDLYTTLFRTLANR